VPIEGAPLRGVQLDADLPQPGIEGAVVRGGEGRRDVDARRERLALTIQCTPPVCVRSGPARRRSRLRFESQVVVGLPRSVRFPARVSPIASRTALPFRHGADAGRYDRCAVAVNGVIHQPRGGRWIRG